MELFKWYEVKNKEIAKRIGNLYFFILNRHPTIDGTYNYLEYENLKLKIFFNIDNALNEAWILEKMEKGELVLSETNVFNLLNKQEHYRIIASLFN